MKSLANRMIKLGGEKDEVFSSSRSNSSNPRNEAVTPSLGELQSLEGRTPKVISNEE